MNHLTNWILEKIEKGEFSPTEKKDFGSLLKLFMKDYNEKVLPELKVNSMNSSSATNNPNEEKYY